MLEFPQKHMEILFEIIRNLKVIILMSSQSSLVPLPCIPDLIICQGYIVDVYLRYSVLSENILIVVNEISGSIFQQRQLSARQSKVYA